jgi:hypothetical protein
MKRHGASRPWSGTRLAAVSIFCISESSGAGALRSGIGAELRVKRKSIMDEAIRMSPGFLAETRRQACGVLWL